ERQRPSSGVIERVAAEAVARESGNTEARTEVRGARPPIPRPRIRCELQKGRREPSLPLPGLFSPLIIRVASQSTSNPSNYRHGPSGSHFGESPQGESRKRRGESRKSALEFSGVRARRRGLLFRIFRPAGGQGGVGP